MNTNEFIRTVRYNLDLSVREFAALLDVDPRNVYRWEAGDNEPSGNIILRILKLCKEQGVDLDDLVFLSF